VKIFIICNFSLVVIFGLVTKCMPTTAVDLKEAVEAPLPVMLISVLDHKKFYLLFCFHVLLLNLILACLFFCFCVIETSVFFCSIFFNLKWLKNFPLECQIGFAIQEDSCVSLPIHCCWDF
jgi:hypothetical protein